MSDQFSVTGGSAAEETIEKLEKPAEEKIKNAGEAIFLGVVRLEEERGQGGAERKRVERRDHRGNRDGQRELFVELAGRAHDEGSGHEHGAEHESDGHDGAADFFHGAACGVVRLISQRDIALDVFDHNDGVVYDDADGEHEAEERQSVQRKSEREHDRKCADQGNGKR